MRTLLGRQTVACLFAGGLLIAACGGDDDDEAADSTAPAAETTADSTAAPETTVATETTAGGPTSEAPTETTARPAAADDRAFKVMVIGDETSLISFTVEEAVPAVEGALAHLPNVEVLHCDSAGDANKANECQREAVDAGVAAVIVTFGQVGQNQSLLTEAGIPVLGGSDPKAATAFSLSNGLASYAALGVAAGAAGCTKVGTLYLDGAEFLADMVKLGVELQGAEEVARAGLAQNTPDIAPAVTTITSADPDCIVLSVTPTQLVQAVTAVDQSGTDAQLIAVGAIVPPEIVEELGDLAEGMFTSEIGLNPSDPSPIVDQIEAEVHAVDPDAEISSVGILSWASAKLIEDALPAIDGDVTAASLTTALQGLVDAPGGGAIHPFTATDIDNPLFARFYNPWGLLYRIEGGVPVRITEDYFSLEASIQAASISS